MQPQICKTFYKPVSIFSHCQHPPAQSIVPLTVDIQLVKYSRNTLKSWLDQKRKTSTNVPASKKKKKSFPPTQWLNTYLHHTISVTWELICHIKGWWWIKHPSPILRNLDNFPPAAFSSTPLPPLQLGTKQYSRWGPNIHLSNGDRTFPAAPLNHD